MGDEIEVFECKSCGYEDSSYLPMRKKLKTVECPKCKNEVEMYIKPGKIGKNMTLKDYAEILDYIDKNHSFRNISGKMIKYITMTLDFRTFEIHSIKLDDKVFSKTNENRHRDLKEMIYEYLNN